MLEKIHDKVVEIILEKSVKTSVKEGNCIKKICPKTLLQCFALDTRCYKAKNCRDVLGQVLRPNFLMPSRSFGLKFIFLE